MGGTQRVGAAAAITHLTVGYQDTAAAAVAVRRLRRSDDQRVRQCDATDSLKCCGSDLSFRFELGSIVDVLPRAASTGPEYRAGRIRALRAGHEQFLDHTPGETRTAARNPHLNAVAGCGKRDEDHASIGRATDTVPTGGEFGDFELDPRLGTRAFPLLASPTPIYGDNLTVRLLLARGCWGNRL